MSSDGPPSTLQRFKSIMRLEKTSVISSDDTGSSPQMGHKRRKSAGKEKEKAKKRILANAGAVPVFPVAPLKRSTSIVRGKSCPDFQDDDLLGEMQGHALFRNSRGEDEEREAAARAAAFPPPPQQMLRSSSEVRGVTEEAEGEPVMRTASEGGAGVHHRSRRKSISKKWSSMMKKSPSMRRKSDTGHHAISVSGVTGGPAIRSASSGKSGKKAKKSSEGLHVVKRTRSKSADLPRVAIGRVEEGNEGWRASERTLDEVNLLLSILSPLPVQLISTLLVRKEGNVREMARYLLDMGWATSPLGIKLLEQFHFTDKANVHFSTPYFHGLLQPSLHAKVRRSACHSFLTCYRPMYSDEEEMALAVSQAIQGSTLPGTEEHAKSLTPSLRRFDEVQYIALFRTEDGVEEMNLASPSVQGGGAGCVGLRFPIRRQEDEDLVLTILPGLCRWEADRRKLVRP